MQRNPATDPVAPAAAENMPRWLGARVLAGLVLVVGLLATALMWSIELSHAERHRRAEFELRVRDIAQRIEQRTALHEQLMRGALGIFEAAPERLLDATTLQRYVAALLPHDRLVVGEGVGLALPVASDGLDEHVRALRRSGLDGYRVWPEGVRDLHAPIVTMAPPHVRNRRAIGRDLFAEPARRDAMERARDSGELRATARVMLAPEIEGGERPGVLMFLPMYRPGSTPATIEERRRLLVGWVVAPFRTHQLIDGILGERADDIDVELYDGERTSAEALLHDVDAALSALDAAAPGLRSEHVMSFAGRRWTLFARSRAAFDERHASASQRAVALAGIGLSAALALLTWALAGGRARAQALAERITRELRRSEEQLRQVGDNLPDSFIFQYHVDARGAPRFLFVSSGVQRMLGVTPEHALADAGALTGRIDPAQAAGFASLVEHSRSALGDFAMDLRMRGADERWRWFQVRSRPRRHDDGATVWDGALTDITERVQADEALRRSEERWAFAIEGAGDGVWDWSIPSGEVQFSRRWAEMLGLQLHELRPHVDEWTSRIHPEDRPKVMQALQDYFDGRAPSYAVEHRVACKDGRHKWILDRGIVISRDDAGRPLRMIGTHTDISEAKRIEAELRLGESRLRAIIDASPVPYVLSDDFHNITLVNPAFERAFGYTLDDVPTLRQWARHAYAEGHYRRWVGSQWAARLERLKRDGGAFEPMEIEVRCADGGVRTVLASAALLEGAFAGTHLVVMHDITERKKAAQALAESEQRFRDLVDSTEGIVWEADAQTFCFTYVSDQALRLLGHPLQAWKQPGFWFEHMHPADREWAPAHRAERTAALKPHDFEYRMLARDGSAVWLRDIVTVVAEDGRARWLRGVMVDITRSKRLEAELRQLATIDFLTGLANRRHFMARLDEEHARLRRSVDAHATIVTFDIDHFKRINDSLGHAAGDEVLRQLGPCVLEELRRNDVAGRLGGEEFAVLLSNTGPAAAWNFADRLRQKITATIGTGELGLTVTVSVGIAAMNAADPGAETALARADQALYRAKSAGRDRVETELPDRF